VLKRHVDSVTPDTLLTDVARRMIAHRTNTLAVCSEGRLIGMLTVHDLILRTTSERRDPSLATVREVMNQKFISCFEDDDVDEALRLMRKRHATQIWIVDRDGHLLGSVSLREALLHVDGARRVDRRVLTHGS
jgi:CBS domain-containing protein